MAKSKPTPPPAAPPVETAGFFAFRTPLLPFDELTAWGAGTRAPAADATALAAALADDQRELRARLVAAVSRPEVREALFVASPSLDESLEVWLREPESERGQKVERTVVRYFARMAGRCTPFGLFAGCSVGVIDGAATRLAVGGRPSYQRHTRLDGDYLSALTDALGRDATLRGAALYRPNSSLYRAAGRLRYAEGRMQGKERSYHLVAVEPTPYLEATLARAANGARLDALVGPLVDDEITREDAADFIGQLVDSQILVSDLAPQVTGREPVHDLIDQLNAQPETAPVAAQLDRARAALAALDAVPLGVAPARYREVAAALDGLPAEAELSRLFQVDMVKPADAAALGPGVAGAVVRAVELLHRMAGRGRGDSMARFREQFGARYEGRELPLGQVLDEESGIGFEKSNAPSAEASPLLEGLAFVGGGEAEETVPWGGRQALLLGKLEEALRSGARAIELDDADLKALERPDAPPLPHSMAAMATLAAADAAALAAGDFRLWFHSLTGPSGANLLGRFCHGDAQLQDHVERHLRDEEAQRPDVIFAEVVHLPEGRVGNVLLRPVLRAHEIPYLGRSGAPREQQISVDDLLVSLQGPRVVLRSRTLGREVVPRLTTAHNFSNPRNLGVYRFLCAVQYQDVPALGWSWGALDSATFLPRVTTGRLVLALARWRLRGPDCRALGEVTGAERFARVRALQKKLGLPRWVAVTDGDNTLPVDLDNALSIETFVHLIKERGGTTLTEIWPGPDELCAHGPEGRFMHELVVPLLRRAAPRVEAAAAPRAPAQPQDAVARLLPPGSGWLYAKLYAGAATADQVLRDVIAPVVEGVMASGAADSWFFIRYGDPDWHVRVRFRGAPERLRSEVMGALEQAAADCFGRDQLWKLQLDTYEREVERYGGPDGIELCEQLFRHDSDAVLGIVATLAGDEGADARWRLALRGMDLLLDDLGLDLDGKRAVIKGCRANFGTEFRAAGVLERQLGDKFRKERRALETLLDPAQDAGSELEPGFELLKQRSAPLQQIAAALHERAAAGRLTATVAELAPSLLHMHANRILRAAARAQELVLYDFLDRLYDGRVARQKKK